MESEVVYYAYVFEVKVGNKYKKFYFENKEDAAVARFEAYCAFDYQRLTIKGFTPPVSQPTRVMLKADDLKNIEVFSSCEDFAKVWYGKGEPETEPTTQQTEKQ